MNIKRSFLLIMFIMVFVFSFIFFKKQITAQSSGGVGGGSTTSYSGGIFGGKIINTKAVEIQTLESSGYQCDVTGTSIAIVPIRGLVSYVIPAGIISKTGRAVTIGKWIIGKYSGKTIVTCILEGDPPDTQMVTLDTITLFGTS